MTLRCSIAGGALAALLGLAGGRAQATEAGDLDVLDYEVDLRVDRARAELRGTEHIQLRSVGGELSSAIFPRNGLDVLSAGISGRARAEYWVTADTIEI